MEKENVELNMGRESPLSDEIEPNNAKVSKLTVEHCVHAYKCQDPSCRQPLCSRMKRIFEHKLVCKRRTKGGCLICREVSALSCDHVKQCTEEKCPMPVPFCLNLKKKIKRLQRQVQRQAELEKELAPSGSSLDSRPATNSQVMGTYTLGVGMKLRSQTPASSVQRIDGRPLLFVVRPPVNKTQEGTQATYSSDPTKTPFQQLQEALQLPDTPEQQRHILLIIKNNPSLLEQYISYRQQLEQQPQ